MLFSDEKTWTVDPVHNRRNDRFMAFGNPEGGDVLFTTKHPASVMSLGFVASNGLKMPLIWFKQGYRLTAADYIIELETKLLPWIRAIFPDNNVVLQQDGAPAHTAKITQRFREDKIAFWDKNIWPPYSPNVNPLDFAFWAHVESIACRNRHPNLNALMDSVNAVWDTMDEEYVKKSCGAFRPRLQAIIDTKGGHIEL
ncbi:uncharacterized protein LOC131890692 [Tigriopus californicus]|uniref:uncharacterized protein LOC131890692 n=1 Tax=Tigriopus californicus TaxID=6832 RepID=UPI0027D9EA4D|nr:uncharacterized protein LOC131890692 [Tigriopus californicus]